MSGTDLSNLQLPAEANSALEGFCNAVTSTFGDDLVSLALYGPAARGGFVAGGTNINVLLMLNDTSLPAMKKLAAPLAAARQAIPLNAFIMTRHQLEESCDVFPIKFMMMKEDYKVLAGADVLADLDITESHLRLRCEQELKNLMLRLGYRYLESSADARKLRSALLGMGQSSNDSLRVLVKLKCGEMPARGDLVEKARAACDLDLSCLGKIDALARDGSADLAQVEAVYGEMMNAITAAADLADKL